MPVEGINLADPDVATEHAPALEKLRHLAAPQLYVDVTGPVTYSAAAHLNRILRLAPGLGEVAITLSGSTPRGHAFGVSSGTGSWPRFVLVGGATLEHPFGHTAGVEKSKVALSVEAVVSTYAVWQLSGMTKQ